MGDIYFTLQSDASASHYPDNKITNFRNLFAVPLQIESGAYEVALVECCYVHSSVWIEKGEVIGESNLSQVGIMKADENILSITDLYAYLLKYNIRLELNFQSGFVLGVSDEIEWSPKLRAILGYCDIEKAYIYPYYMQSGNTQMYIYCDIVDLQRVGHEMVPLLRKMDYTGENGKVLTRSFSHLQYVSLSRDDISGVHMYIKNEAGENLPLTFGSFSATLHLRRRRF